MTRRSRPLVVDAKTVIEDIKEQVANVLRHVVPQAVFVPIVLLVLFVLALTLGLLPQNCKSNSRSISAFFSAELQPFKRYAGCPPGRPAVF